MFTKRIQFPKWKRGIVRVDPEMNKKAEGWQ